MFILKYSSFELWGFIIALIALFISFYSIYYTKKGDKYSIEVKDTYIRTEPGRPALVSFSIFNDSKNSLKILKVELFFSDGRIMKPLDYVPEQTYSQAGFYNVPNYIHSSEYSSPLEHEEILAPYTEIDLSYYVNPYSLDINVKVTCDKPINKFAKEKLFSIHLIKSE